jgi:hypothetical protein
MSALLDFLVDGSTYSFSRSAVLDYGTIYNPAIWAMRYRSLSGRPYGFEALDDKGKLDLRPEMMRFHRPFLYAPLADLHPQKSYRKSRQCGMTENETSEVLWGADCLPSMFSKPDINQVYVFPTKDMVEDHSKTRVAPVIEQIPHLKEKYDNPVDRFSKPGDIVKLDPIQHVRLKRIDTTNTYFRSGATPKAGEGIPIDVVYFDEIDRMVDNVLIAFNETMSASPIKWRRDISTPSLPNAGVDKSFQLSDKRYWVMKCPHCGGYFTLLLEWPDCVQDIPAHSRLKFAPLRRGTTEMEQTHVYVHAKGPLGPGCGGVIDDVTRLTGAWVAAYPSRKEWRGYQISQLICGWISATEVMKKVRDYALIQLFHNYVLGLPYAGDNILLQRHHIEQCIDNTLDNLDDIRVEDVATGCDWGDQSWQLAGMPWNDGKNMLLLDINYITGTPDEHVDKAASFIRYWDPSVVVNDAGYGKDRNYALLQQFPGRVWSCQYPNSDQSKAFVEGWAAEKKTVGVDRTMTLKVMARAFRERKIKIPLWVVRNPTLVEYGAEKIPVFEAFVRHLTSLASIVEIDDETGARTERIGHIGPDHFAHASNYLLIALREVMGWNLGDFFW